MSLISMRVIGQPALVHTQLVGMPSSNNACHNVAINLAQCTKQDIMQDFMDISFALWHTILYSFRPGVSVPKFLLMHKMT